MGASSRTGLSSAEAPEPSGLGPTGAIPSAAHTPLPWGISYGFHMGRFGQAPATYIAGPNPEQIGIKIATPWVDGSWDNDPEADANVAFIVRACNAHYLLVSALQQFVSGVETRMIDSPADDILANVTNRARKALATARGEVA